MTQFLNGSTNKRSQRKCKEGYQKRTQGEIAYIYYYEQPFERSTRLCGLCAIPAI